MAPQGGGGQGSSSNDVNEGGGFDLRLGLHA